MFDKLKQLKQLKDLQDQVKKEKYTVEKNGVLLEMNGGFELEKIQLNPSLSAEEQEKAILEAHQELLRKVQMAMAQQFQGLMG